MDLRGDQASIRYGIWQERQKRLFAARAALFHFGFRDPSVESSPPVSDLISVMASNANAWKPTFEVGRLTAQGGAKECVKTPCGDTRMAAIAFTAML